MSEVQSGRALLSDKRLDGNDAAWQALVGHCGGNGLALKVVGETTREVFGGSIADFLEYATETAGVVVGRFAAGSLASAVRVG